MLQNRKVFMTKKITKWKNTNGCDEKYICVTALYLLSMLYHAYKIVIDRSFGAPGHGKCIVYGLDATDKLFL